MEEKDLICYENLLASYKRMYAMMDAIHFNSQNTYDIYTRYLASIPIDSKVIPITHKDIGDHRRIKEYSIDRLNLGFIGSETPYKGLPLLKRVISRLNKLGYEDSLTLKIYGGRIAVDGILPNVFYCGKFAQAEMKEIYSEMDLLVVPSIWYETFSLATIEALQYGVPVLVSDKVGAKDFVRKYDSRFIFKSEEGLFNIIHEIIDNKDLLREYNRRIVEMEWDMSMSKHAKQIEKNIYNH